ncbi:hypothetical protein GCM10012286_14700 [Streptomyces lasiicapitis]|uniref:Uncharacterized protein n=1 Tax=Streptomyces lasiicapitis TaxID=1923961 RepID=A0ABQ2LLB8_9ACTN|nr:hypothetical protein GCM10012286_14700 [Streptomyces lasiicapitis]
MGSAGVGIRPGRPPRPALVRVVLRPAARKGAEPATGWVGQELGWAEPRAPPTSNLRPPKPQAPPTPPQAPPARTAVTALRAATRTGSHTGENGGA